MAMAAGQEWDLVLQASHQSQCYRLLQFFEDPKVRRRVFPGEVFARAGAYELGPHTEKQGPATVLFSQLDMAPEAFMQWFTGVEGWLLRRHIKRFYFLPHAPLPQAPSQQQQQQQRDQHHAQDQEGVQSACTSDKAAPSGHPCDSNSTGMQQHGEGGVPDSSHQSVGQPTSGSASTTRESLLQAITAQGPGDPGTVLRLYCHPKSLERFLQEKLPEAFQLHPSRYTHVLQVVEVEGELRWCVLPSAWVYLQSCEEQKALPDVVAHAVNKLDEALVVSGLRDCLGSSMHAAIDVGAAPGAWSMFLAKFASRVIAVDPAQLHPDALRDNITHLRLKAEDAVPHVQQILGERQADVLTCDMNMHPARASKVIEPLLPFVKPGGVVILTLKLTGTGRDRRQLEQRLRNQFEGTLEQGRVMWLLANTIYEQTFIAIKSS